MSSKPTNDNIFIGIDAGTSVIKAVAFSAAGDTLAVASRANSYRTLSNGGVEQNMERTWNDTLAVLKELIVANPDYAERVVSISVTGQGDGTWLLDTQGRPVQAAWLWLDARSSRQVEQIIQSPHYEEIFGLTGASVNVCQTRSQLRWMLEHTPEVVEKTAVSLHCKDYLYFNLTGVLATDPSEGVSNSARCAHEHTTIASLRT
ncbi:MAG: FGGY family carbohydrate kinase [Chloroflexota bacterium]